LYEKEKKNSNISFLNVLGRHEMLREGRKEGKKDMKDNEKVRS
jgi:hypothetical protein